MVERKKGAGGERGAKTRRTEDSKGKRGNEAETAKGRGPRKGEEWLGSVEGIRGAVEKAGSTQEVRGPGHTVMRLPVPEGHI